MTVPVNDKPTLTTEGRPLRELRDTGLLWLINRVVFHPRGFALALIGDKDGNVTSWRLEGDGTEAWTFGDVDEDVMVRKVNELLRPTPPSERLVPEDWTE